MPSRAIAFGAGVASLFAPLNSSMLAVALPAIRRDFDLSVGSVTWLNAYLVAVTTHPARAAARTGRCRSRNRRLKAIVRYTARLYANR